MSGPTLEPSFRTRGFGRELTPPFLTWEAERLEWRAVGGSYRAQLTAAGNPSNLWRLANMLRYGVEILTPGGIGIWHGYIHEIELDVGDRGISLSLDTLSNRIAVAYAYVPAGSATHGTRATTAWVQDDLSVVEYGTKELLETNNSADTTTATTQRDTLLDIHKYPIAVPLRGRGTRQARIECRGWWETLGWRYLDTATTASVETTTLVADAISAYAPLITDTVIQDASGVNDSEYREGDSTVRFEVEKWLELGSSSNRRMLANVNDQREAVLYQAPTNTTARWYEDTDGRLYDRYGNVQPRWTPGVGNWIEFKDVAPAVVDTGKINLMDIYFCERAEYDVRTGVMTRYPRGQAPWYEIAGIRPG